MPFPVKFDRASNICRLNSLLQKKLILINLRNTSTYTQSDCFIFDYQTLICWLPHVNKFVQ
jgi:hypothetical protein